MMKVPFQPLLEQYKPISDEIHQAVERVLASGRYLMGPELEAFEEAFASYCCLPHCAGVASGTDALTLSLMAAGVGPGDEVITVPNSFIATALAVIHTGATPVFVDVEPATSLMNLDLIEAAITPKTKAVIPVHLYGLMVDMPRLEQLAGAHDLIIIEDAAQAVGATWDGEAPGTHSNAAAFSFYPAKNLGALGDGGAVVSSDSDLIERVKSLRFYGQSAPGVYQLVGVNSRLDEIQSAVLRAKLKYLDGWTTRRQELAKQYIEGLKDTALQLPHNPKEARHVFHRFTVHCTQRDELKAHLEQAGIETGIYYPAPIHLQSSMSMLGYKESDFPVAEQLAKETLSLPFYPEMPDEHVESVIELIYKLNH